MNKSQSVPEIWIIFNRIFSYFQVNSRRIFECLFFEDGIQQRIQIFVNALQEYLHEKEITRLYIFNDMTFIVDVVLS